MSSAASPNRTGEAREARELRLRARNIGIDIDTFRPGRYGAIWSDYRCEGRQSRPLHAG